MFGLMLTLCYYFSYGQNAEYCQKADMLVKTVEKFHFKPKPIDEKFSALVFDNFINRVDPYGIYLTKNDINNLAKYKSSIGNDITTQNCNFLNQAQQVFKREMKSVDSLVNSFASLKVDLNTMDSLIINQGEFVNDKVLLTERWKKLLKLQMLNYYFATIDSSELKQKPSVQKLDEIKNAAIRRELCHISSMNNYKGGIDAYLANIYLKSIAEAFDPHTEYFTPDENNAFSDLLSKETVSFGFNISQNDYGEIEIYQIIPGGPAWNSGMINEGDIIVKTTASGTDKLFDCIDIEEATNYLSASELTQADFVIKKESGKQITVHLQKDKTEVEENVIKSFILQGEKRIAYIYLPSFYTQMDGSINPTSGCANNLATELVKLKKEKIDGLILDLRDNGGGSMMEAVLMTGIFIDYGAVGIISSHDGVPQTLKDMNRGTIYDNPLIILVNEFSASASEFFAAAMQDQNRAIVVGSKTFGKSTFQNIIPIDAYKYDNLDNYAGNQPGFVKVTSGAFYRVTGLSHQKVGIIPDIKLPTYYSYCDFGEQSYKTAIDSLSVSKKAYYYPGPALPKLDLQRLSLQRTENNKMFNEIEKQSILLAQKQHRYAFSLNLEAFKKEYFEEDLHADETGVTTVFKVENPGYYKAINNISNANQKMNENSINLISDDLYIIEGYQIIKDLINLKKNNTK